MAGHLGVGRVLTQRAQEQRRHPEHAARYRHGLRPPGGPPRRSGPPVPPRHGMLDDRSVGSVEAQPRGVGVPAHASFREEEVDGGHRVVESPVLARVRELVAPIVSDLGARPVRPRAAWRHAARHARHARRRRPRGVTLDDAGPGQPPGRPASSTTTTRCPATTRSRSPAPASSGRCARPAHFRREVGKVVAIRLPDVGHDERRVTGMLVAADDDSATVAVDVADGPTSAPSPSTRSTGPRPSSNGAPRSPKPSRASPPASGPRPVPRHDRQSDGHRQSHEGAQRR